METTKVSLLRQLYRSMYRIRRLEEEVAVHYPTDKIKSPVHLSIGQEAISVGVCEAIRSDDIVFGTYRGHAMYLAKGGDMNRMVAELYGKVDGCAKGKGGSMHLVDVSRGVMGTSAIVGTSIPNSVGYAYALKLKRSDSLVVSFFGDGAVDEGAFHESLNFAALKKLPVLFICENNCYAIHSHHMERRHSDNLCERARSYGMPAERIDDSDILKIYNKTKEYAQYIRNGNGPVFLECDTSRWREHVGPNEDFHLGYRTEDDIATWIENDQLKRLKKMLDAEGLTGDEEEIENEISEAFAYAEESPFPDRGDLYSDLYKE